MGRPVAFWICHGTNVYHGTSHGTPRDTGTNIITVFHFIKMAFATTILALQKKSNVNIVDIRVCCSTVVQQYQHEYHVRIYYVYIFLHMLLHAFTTRQQLCPSYNILL